MACSGIYIYIQTLSESPTLELVFNPVVGIPRKVERLEAIRNSIPGKIERQILHWEGKQSTEEDTILDNCEIYLINENLKNG